MNKKGVFALVNIMLGLLVIITIIAVSGALKQQVSQARSNLDCTNESLSPGETGTCIVVDWTFPAFAGLGLLVGIGYLVHRKLNANAGVQ